MIYLVPFLKFLKYENPAVQDVRCVISSKNILSNVK